MDTTTYPRNGIADVERLLSPLPPAEPAPPTGAHRAQDAITRLRDKWGNRLPWFYAHSVPLAHDRPVAQTALAPALARIQAALPVLGGALEHDYDEKLVRTYERLLAVTDEETAQLRSQNARAESVNAALDAEDHAINAADREAVAGREAALPEAHALAAERVAATGGHYGL